MENELRDKEELGNPMDAVTGVQTKQEKKRAKKAASNPGKPKRQSLLVQVLNGEILTRDFVLNNLTFIFFILFLLMLMVAKGYYGKQLQTDINELQTELDATTAEYIENKAKLEESTTRYRLVQALEKRGLREMTDPAKVIRVKKKENE